MKRKYSVLSPKEANLPGLSLFFLIEEREMAESCFLFFFLVWIPKTCSKHHLNKDMWEHSFLKLAKRFKKKEMRFSSKIGKKRF